MQNNYEVNLVRTLTETSGTAETFVGAGSGVARREGVARRLSSRLLPSRLGPAVRVRGNVSMIDSKRTCPANRRRRARACLLVTWRVQRAQRLQSDQLCVLRRGDRRPKHIASS